MRIRTFLLLGASVVCLSMQAETQNEGIQDTTQMSEVVVTGTRNATDVRHLPLTVTSISNEKLNENYRSSVLPTVTEQTPGLFSTSRGVLGYGVSTGAAGSMMVRGVGSGAQLLVLIDGQPQYAGLMGHPIPDVYQTLMTEKVEVVRGPASLLYGSNAMAGVVNIVTRQMNEDGCKTNIRLQGGSYGTFQADGVNRFRKGKFSTVVGAQYMRTDGHRPNSNFEQFGGYAKIGYDFSEHWKAVADANLTHFNASNPGPVYAPLVDNDSKITRGLASISLSNGYQNTSGTLRAYYDWGHHNIDDGYNLGGTPKTALYKHDDYIAGITWYQSAHFFEGNTVTVGLDWQHFGGSAWNADKQTGAKTYLVKDEDGNLVENQHADEVGTYIDFRQDICKWLTVDAGLRVDWHSVVGTELIPQGGLAFHPTRNADIKALVSKGFRNPIIREMYMFPPATTDLKPERMMNYELAYTQRIAGKVHIGANIFYIKGENLINTVRVDGRPRNVNTGDFENWGLEFSADYTINRHWSVDGNYSYLRMQTPITGAPEGKLYFGGKYHNDKWTATAGVQNISGLYITAGDNPQKENFTLLNASVSYRALPWLTLFAKGENLLAEQYQTYDGFFMPKATFMGGASFEF
ncbi:MAG: TonB-dependent receptor [Bacteroidaceae bacterium]|nr:TonB-dependent receptor [Bacteroidaceae bacterium]MBP5629986.1 TonB-dependent receptor [Bacteroidaceae bacterium]